MRRGYVISLLGIVLLSAAAFGWTVQSGNSPALGLDLKGGVSVVLEPKKGTRVPAGALDQSIEIIRNRVDALGVAEPEIAREGNAIVIQMPGIEDTQRALDLVGQTAELRFRPVKGQAPCSDPTATTTTTAPGATTTTATIATTATTAPPPEGATTTTAGPTTTTTAPPSTPRDQNTPEAEVVLPGEGLPEGVCYQLGPAEMKGDAIATARRSTHQQTGEWIVLLDFKKARQQEAGALFQKYVGQELAFELDGVVESAPTINNDSGTFDGRPLDQVSIDGGGDGGFSGSEASDLATVLRYGSLPVQLIPSESREVSATLGSDSLRAGVIAGLVGLVLVLIYIVFFYRALGLVTILGLAISSMILWAIVAYLGDVWGLTLSLSGVTGLIVSIGITVDSDVVFFERLKDDIRSGRSARSSVEKSFNSAFRTIMTANISSLIAAVLLWWLTVGPVRGFAFFLGLSTLIDIFTAILFTRPLVTLLARSRMFTEMRGMGIARGLNRVAG